jgi:hypothetical protein
MNKEMNVEQNYQVYLRKQGLAHEDKRQQETSSDDSDSGAPDMVTAPPGDKKRSKGRNIFGMQYLQFLI